MRKARYPAARLQQSRIEGTIEMRSSRVDQIPAHIGPDIGLSLADGCQADFKRNGRVAPREADILEFDGFCVANTVNFRRVLTRSVTW